MAPRPRLQSRRGNRGKEEEKEETGAAYGGRTRVGELVVDGVAAEHAEGEHREEVLQVHHLPHVRLHLLYVVLSLRWWWWWWSAMIGVLHPKWAPAPPTHPPTHAFKNIDSSTLFPPTASMAASVCLQSTGRCVSIFFCVKYLAKSARSALCLSPTEVTSPSPKTKENWWQWQW